MNCGKVVPERDLHASVKRGGFWGLWFHRESGKCGRVNEGR